MFEKLFDQIQEDRNSLLDSVIQEWESKNRNMGCVAATDWFIKRAPGFKAIRLNRYTKNGELYQHVAATDGKIIIDLAPYADIPNEYNPEVDGIVKPELD